MMSDPIALTTSESFIYNLFFAAVSATIGFGTMVWFWFHGLFSRHTPRRRINYISAFSMFWGMALLYVISKTGFSLTWILFTMDGYDDHLNLSREFPALLFLLPTVLFLNIWVPIRLTYRSGAWFLKALGGYFTLSLILAFSSPINHAKINGSWKEYMRPYNEIVDNEIKKAASKGIKISPGAVETIRFNKKERVLRQAKNLKERFRSARPVPTDTVVLELIAVKKSTIRELDVIDWQDQAARWPFALPRDVFRQIKMGEDSIKNRYLREIWSEYESIFRENWEDLETIDQSEIPDKCFNRSSMQRRYQKIFFELQHFQGELQTELLEK
jgi:hypothetical protein